MGDGRVRDGHVHDPVFEFVWDELDELMLEDDLPLHT